MRKQNHEKFNEIISQKEDGEDHYKVTSVMGDLIYDSNNRVLESGPTSKPKSAARSLLDKKLLIPPIMHHESVERDEAIHELAVLAMPEENNQNYYMDTENDEEKKNV
jgi:hypothetical protein